MDFEKKNYSWAYHVQFRLAMGLKFKTHQGPNQISLVRVTSSKCENVKYEGCIRSQHMKPCFFFLQSKTRTWNVTWVPCGLISLRYTKRLVSKYPRESQLRFTKRRVSNQRGTIVFIHVFGNPFARSGEYSEERFVDSVKLKITGRKRRDTRVRLKLHGV